MTSAENSPLTPWLHEESFWQQNQIAFRDLFTTIARQNPDSGIELLLEQDTAPSQEAMAWMWQHFMGRQHGTMEGTDGKISLPREQEYTYWPDFNRVRYGEHYFAVPSMLDTEREYTKAFILSGTQQENIERLLTVVAHNPANENVREIIMMSGQRLRGWNAPGERSPEELLSITQTESETDIETLRHTSPFIQAELKKNGTEWQAPFATEYTMCRLAVEAVFQNHIDWKQYSVETTLDSQAEALQYGDDGEKTVPPREEVMATYILNDNRRVHVINGKAIPRPNGAMPRPTSDSQTRESVDLLLPKDAREEIVIASSIPHTRAAVDALVRILAMRRASVIRADIVTGKWLPWKELIAGFGEFPATHKADRRLRAVLDGKDPDSQELTRL